MMVRGTTCRARIALSLLCLIGCNNTPPPQPVEAVSVPQAPALQDPVGDTLRRVQLTLAEQNPGLKPEAVQFQPRDGELVAAELQGAGISDLSPLVGLPLEVLGLADNPVVDLTPLRGMPLKELVLERTQVTDLLPLAGMPLVNLWLNEAPVSDLTPLVGAPLVQLSLLGTQVSDLTPLKGMPLESVWLNETQVTDLSPLAESPIISLTLHKTPVRDIAVVRQWPTLQRLHLGEAEVTDLTPLEGLRLTRLILTTGKITAGMDVIRSMGTLTELDIEFREPRPWPPEEFWRRYDAGELK